MPAYTTNSTVAESPIPQSWSFYCALIATMGFAGFYADWAQRYVPTWVVVGVLVAPFAVLVCVHWNELPDRVVMTFHLGAATLFLLLAAGMEISHFMGYQPEGANFFRVLAHLGWTFAWADTLRQIRARNQALRSVNSP